MKEPLQLQKRGQLLTNDSLIQSPQSSDFPAVPGTSLKKKLKKIEWSSISAIT